jgi:hypothetical protein
VNPAIRDPAEPAPPPKPRPPDLEWLNRLPLRDGLELKPDAIAPRKARQQLSANLEKWSLLQLGISAPLVLSEIVTNARAATNAVFAAYTLSGGVGAVPPVTVWLYGWPSAVAMLAWDASCSPPEPQCAGPDDESGRGLAIIDLMSADWGYYFPAGIGGKITTFSTYSSWMTTGELTAWSTRRQARSPARADSPQSHPARSTSISWRSSPRRTELAGTARNTRSAILELDRGPYTS